MIYDVYDYNFLRLCSYFPKDLQERYKSELLGYKVYKNLQKYKRACRNRGGIYQHSYAERQQQLNDVQGKFIANYIEKITGKYYVFHRLPERMIKNRLFTNLDTMFQRQAVEKDGVTFPVKPLK